jgi:hypothetical protein
LLFVPATAWAHAGSGQPYVLINGQYAPGNPVASIYQDMGQDVAPAVYVVNQPINFAMDTNVVSADAFRWIWDNQQTNDGSTVSHTFATVGTHIVKIQVKNMADSNFTDLSTLAVSVAPMAGYKLPSSKIKLTQLRQGSTGHTIRLEVLDPISSADIKSYQWKFGDGQTAQGQVVEHKYSGTEWIYYPALRLTDQNGLYNDIAVQLQGSAKGIAPVDMPSTPGILTVGTAAPPQSRMIWFIVGAIGLLLISELILQTRRLRS